MTLEWEAVYKTDRQTLWGGYEILVIGHQFQALNIHSSLQHVPAPNILGRRQQNNARKCPHPRSQSLKNWGAKRLVSRTVRGEKPCCIRNDSESSPQRSEWWNKSILPSHLPQALLLLSAPKLPAERVSWVTHHPCVSSAPCHSHLILAISPSTKPMRIFKMATVYHTDTCRSVCTAGLFTTARNWPRCPSTGK